MSSLKKEDIYRSLLSDYTSKADASSKRLRGLSLIRLLLFLAACFLAYEAIVGRGYLFTAGAIILVIIFLVVLRVYDRLEQDILLYRSLAKLNSNEADFLDGKASVYDTGKEYTDPHHPYSYDLDIFGEGGLFPYLNRTATHFGKRSLAHLLLHPDTAEIIDRQHAIAELSGKLEFRQQLQAYGMIQEIKEKELRQLRGWIAEPGVFHSKVFYYFFWIFPLLTLSSLIYYSFSENENFLNWFFILFLLNITIVGFFGKTIKMHLSISTAVNKVLQQFSRQLSLLESQPFQSSLLLHLQSRLKAGNTPASRSIFNLSSLFDHLDTVINLIVSPLLNGFFLFHIHILYRIERWKQQHGNSILDWLELLGQAEVFSSQANFSYNNPGFTNPVIKETGTLSADEMGHPLIRAGKRVNNSISFDQHRFIILTGSNMSGKSTFLRTLGINLVLARAGSVVCARQFVFYPFAIEVSMRISDSLQDSESFFYAELKRLQHIIRQLEDGVKLFVILDEILRGTNSNDKHNGTVGLIRKLVAANACGIIATHDLTVSRLVEEYPEVLGNKCFESQIVNDELLFDYKLGDGVCTTLSASFLMKKMGVI